MSVSSNFSSYSPELNPIEQVWRWLRQRDLSNQSFMDYDDIISKSAMHGIGFGLLPKSPKCAREDG
ncbi:hypothetical protein GA076_23115 [Vibrio parahaemolyticus]|nr:transposase [Vibrio parahaemolyticus]EGQ9060095.1 hypothetical protein [Vibrio parahaemolyticus]EGR2232361.1 hypothetical protein [Vibrio parahaemolyticus]EGU9031126.1 hypothetical protein [Vibrio parahaemolyticus]EHR0760586.1 transposase [Vibrio parahaemolyticus]EHR0831293.1 transposase [Vibrio parahaemolyticus]